MFKRLKIFLLPLAILAATLGVAPVEAITLPQTRVGGSQVVDDVPNQAAATRAARLADPDARAEFKEYIQGFSPAALVMAALSGVHDIPELAIDALKTFSIQDTLTQIEKLVKTGVADSTDAIRELSGYIQSNDLVSAAYNASILVGEKAPGVVESQASAGAGYLLHKFIKYRKATKGVHKNSLNYVGETHV